MYLYSSVFEEKIVGYFDLYKVLTWSTENILEFQGGFYID